MVTMTAMALCPSPSWLKCLFSSDGTLDYEQLYNTLRNNNIKSLDISVFNQIQLPETGKKQDNKPFDISLIKDNIKFNLKWTPSDGKIGCSSNKSHSS